jgi:hypothetical protein
VLNQRLFCNSCTSVFLKHKLSISPVYTVQKHLRPLFLLKITRIPQNFALDRTFFVQKCHRCAGWTSGLCYSNPSTVYAIASLRIVNIRWLVHSHDPRLAYRWMDSLIVSKKSKILAQSQYQAWLSSCAPVKSLNSGILLTLNYLSTKK